MVPFSSPSLSNGPNANLLTIPKQRSSSVTLTYHSGPRRAGEPTCNAGLSGFLLIFLISIHIRTALQALLQAWAQLLHRPTAPSPWVWAWAPHHPSPDPPWSSPTQLTSWQNPASVSISTNLWPRRSVLPISSRPSVALPSPCAPGETGSTADFYGCRSALILSALVVSDYSSCGRQIVKGGDMREMRQPFTSEAQRRRSGTFTNLSDPN